MKKATLFLGAGASAFAKRPITRELRERTLSNIRKKRSGPIDDTESSRLEILDHIVQDERLDDIEKVYSCVDHILSSYSQYSQIVLNRMTYQDRMSMSLPDMLKAFGTLKRIIRETILANFTVGGDQETNIANLYGSLFDVVGGTPGRIDIITTNYDNIIETYCNHTGALLVDGFVPSRNGDHRVWKDSWDMEDNCVRLVKLHGSVTWQRDGNSIIEMKQPGSREDEDDILIAPTLDTKNYSKKPFPRLFKQCDTILSHTDALIVIGYSFRDVGINERLVDAMRRGVPVLVVSPSADEDVRMNLKPPAKLKGIRIETVPEEFGRDEIAGLCDRVSYMLNGNVRD